MKRNKMLMIFIIIASFFIIKNFCFDKIYSIEDCGSQNMEEVLNYNLYTSFKKDNIKLDRSDLVTNDGIFPYDINFELEGNGQKFKVISFIDYVPQSFSIDDDGFSMKKDLCIDSSINKKLRFKNKIEGFSACDFILIPDNIGKNQEAVNRVHCFTSIINKIEDKNETKNQNIRTIKGKNISGDNNFSFLINAQYKNEKLVKNEKIIKCKPKEKINIPVIGNLNNQPNCNYMIFLNDDVVKLNNNKFCNSIRTTDGNIFCDNINIISPDKKGRYTLWGLIHYNLYEQDPSNAVSSNNSIILQVE